MENQNWTDPEGTDSRGWVRSHRETEASSPEGIKRTAYGTDFSNPQGQYEYQEWNGQRNPSGDHSGQWPEQKDYGTSSPETKSQTSRPQDRHQNAQTQQAEQTQHANRHAPNPDRNERGDEDDAHEAAVIERNAKLAEPDSSLTEKTPRTWDANESNQSLGEDGQYEENRDSKYGTIKPLHDPQY